MREFARGVQRAVNHAGSTIQYWADGEVDDATVVLTHGVTIDHGTFAEQVPALRDAGYRVITWDLRGHGESQPMGEGFELSIVLEDLESVLRSAGVSKAVFVGQSFAGWLVQEFYSRRPEGVVGLVVIGAPGLGQPLPFVQGWLQRLRPLILRLWPERHLRRVIPLFLSKKEDVRRYVARATLALSKADLIAVTRAALDALMKSETGGEVRVPTLAVYGEGEMSMIRRMIDDWKSDVTSLHTAVIPDAGHLANQDNSAAFNAVLLEFLRAHFPITPAATEG